MITNESNTLSGPGVEILTNTPDDNLIEEDDEKMPFGQIICLIGLIVCSLALMSLILAKFWLVFDMATHFSLHYILIGMCFLIGLMLPKWHLRSALVMIIIAVAGIGIWAKSAPSSTMAVNSLASNNKTLKIMTFNTWFSNNGWKQVAAEIQRTDPDVVAMMEFGRDKAPLLKALKSEYPYQQDCFAVPYCHLAVISKYPMAESNSKTRWVGPPYTRVKFGPELSGLTLFAVHTIRPPYYNAHMKQIRTLIGEINHQKGLRLVMGDFNATPYSQILKIFGRRTGLKRITTRPTWPASFASLPQIAIDHIFMSPEISVVEAARIGRSSGSDHFPVSAVISLPIK